MLRKVTTAGVWQCLMLSPQVSQWKGDAERCSEVDISFNSFCFFLSVVVSSLWFVCLLPYWGNIFGVRAGSGLKSSSGH